MKCLKILGTRPNKHPFPIVSLFIRLFEWSKISHVGICFSEEGEVFNAHFNNLEFQTRENYEKKHKTIYEVTLPLTNNEYDNMLKRCKELEGAQSGYWITFLGAMVPQLLRVIFGMKIKHPFPKGYTCSWLVLELFDGAGYKYDGKVDPPNITTKDIIEFSSIEVGKMPKSRFLNLK